MAYCPNCGEEGDADASFCQNCGAELKTDDKTTASDSAAEPTSEGVSESEQTINWRHAAAAVAFALLPAIGAYLGASIALYKAVGIVFVIALPAFAYLLYKRPTKKAMAGGMCFWLAIEAFLTPFILLIYTFVFASQETATGAEQAGAAIGGFIMVIVAFVVGLPIGIVLYLISRRLDPSEQTQGQGEPA